MIDEEVVPLPLRIELAFADDFHPIAHEARRRTLDAARVKLGEAAFADAWVAGEIVSIEEASQAAALMEEGECGRHTAEPNRPGP